MKLDIESKLYAIIVWPHGLKYKDNILSLILDSREFDISRIIKYRPKSMRRFVNEVYSYDYAPVQHLKNKIRYLNCFKDDLLCVILKSNSKDFDLFGEGGFRHKELLSLKKLKTTIREKYNPYDNGVMTHDHIIHATDNEEQTYHILKAIDGVDLIDFKNRSLFNFPFFLGKVSRYRIIEIDSDRLVCGQAVGDSHDFIIRNVAVRNSVQYLSLLSGDSTKYRTYIDKFTGTALKSFYSVERFYSLSINYKYLSENYENEYIAVKETKSGKYLILDGLHRAAIHIFQGNTKIKVCVII